LRIRRSIEERVEDQRSMAGKGQGGKDMWMRGEEVKGRRVSRAMVAMGLGPLVGKAFRRRGEIKSLGVIKEGEVSAEERRLIGVD